VVPEEEQPVADPGREKSGREAPADASEKRHRIVLRCFLMEAVGHQGGDQNGEPDRPQLRIKGVRGTTLLDQVVDAMFLFEYPC